MGTLKTQSNGPLYSNTVIDTLSEAGTNLKVGGGTCPAPNAGIFFTVPPTF